MVIREYINKNIELKGFKVDLDAKLDVIKPLANWNHSALFVGTAGSGKTSLYSSLILEYYKKQFTYIYYFNGSIQTAPERLIKKLYPDRTFNDLSQLNQAIDFCIREKEKCLFIIDDLVYQIKEYEKTLQRLLMNRRHMGASVWLITQKLNTIPLSLRSQFDICYFFSGNQKREVESLYTDFIQDLDKDEYLDIIKYVFDEPHSFLYIDKRNGKYYKRFNRLELIEDSQE